MPKDESKAIGGRARAASLSEGRKSEIAQGAAKARWDAIIPAATHEGELKLGDGEVKCFVLQGGERIISTRGMMKALGRTWRGRKYAGTELPVFIEANNLKPFIDNDLESVLAPVKFRTPSGLLGDGYKAEVLPAVCDVYLKARDGGALLAGQLGLAKQCEMLIRALSKVGIIALVDEATGYQEVRDRLALQGFLDKFLRAELAAWAKRFPDEFYQQIFRLRGWEWRGMKVNRPQVVATYTKDIVYERLAPGVLAELESRNPKNASGHRQAKHHQWLTDDLGQPALSQHLHAVIGLMRASTSWDTFKVMLNRAFPKRGDSMELPL